MTEREGIENLFEEENILKIIANFPVPYRVKDRDELKNIISYAPNDADLNHLDVRNVTDMSNMFKSSNFNGNISNWDVSNVTNIGGGMFKNSPLEGKEPKWYKD